MFCIPRNLTEVFLEKVKSGEINPEKMASMTSKERRDYFASFLGEANAKQVNALFESKLLLQNQQQGIINWAKQVSGLKPEAQRDILSRVNKMTEILTPETEAAFLEDIAAHKLGVTVTLGEASRISELAKTTAEAKADLEKGGDRFRYGRARVAFEDYVNELKTDADKKTLLDRVKNPIGSAIDFAGLTKSLKASLDNSVIGRQGLKTLITHPEIWYKNSIQSFKDIVDTFGGKEVLDEVRADILSRPNSLNGLYKKEKLAVGVTEEAYPTSLPEKIPIIGKAFKASEAAFTAFQYRTRADVFDKLVDIADKTGADIKGIGKLANSLTGRGNLGALEPAANVVNNVLFSPRFLKSNIDTLTAHIGDKNIGAFARKQAAINRIKIVGAVGVVLSIAKAVNPDSVELDPRSSDFGKIKVGDTRFDISGGMAGLVTLAARLITQSSKSTSTKTISKLNSGKYGSKTGLDVFLNFLENKASPGAGVILDILKGDDFKGNKTTIAGEAQNLLVPIDITNFDELRNDPNSANILLSMISDGLGVSTNTYNSNVDWSLKGGAELNQFHARIGDDKFKEANGVFNDRFSKWLEKANASDRYRKLDDEEKQNVITEERSKIKENIFREYGFHYKKESKRLPNI